MRKHDTRAGKKTIMRSTAGALCLTLMIMAILLAKASYHARLEFTRGEEAVRRDDINAAITHYERAIKWHTPFSRSARHAVERLWTIGTTAEKRKDFPIALNAYWSLRAGVYAVQSFYLPYQEWIAKTEQKIASLMAKTAHPEEHPSEPSWEERDHERFTAMLQRKTAPHQGGVIVTEIGFLGWVGATVCFIWYAMGENGVWIWQRCLLWGSTIAIFFSVWIIGMLLA